MTIKKTVLATSLAVATAFLISPNVSWAQDDAEDVTRLDRVEVTGSRIKKSAIEGQSPVLSISREDIEKTGLTSLADVLQQLPVAGSALNTRFNSSGNFGFPPDGGGIGAGSSQIALRHLDANRTLVLVNGKRWVPGAAASGVPSAVDLNTIPLSMIDRIDVLTDGASSVYGSDAIAGVVNIITRREFDGFEARGYIGDYEDSGGETSRAEVAFGSTGEKLSTFFTISYTDQERISAGDREISMFPVPGTGVTRGSSGTPQGRYILTDPNTGQPIDVTLNNGVSGIPVYDPSNPNAGGDYHPFSNDDRFNFSPFNLLLTPSERTSLYGDARYNLTDRVTYYARALYTKRKSTNQAAPEPIFLGPGAGTGGLADTISIDVSNPFNPYGFTLDAATNFVLLGRRPLEGGPRVFTQDVDTYYIGTGLEGDFDVGDNIWYWDANYIRASNRADQIKTGGYNIARIAEALGPLDDCLAIPGCVPLNLFGGQGGNGQGTITNGMLGYIGFTQKDVSENNLSSWTFNIGGDVVQLPAGPLAIAAGYEYRDQDGFFQPDAVVVAGESNGVPSQPTSGGFEVDEFYVEGNFPLLSQRPGAELLDLTLAVRHSDYSTFGSVTTTKAGFRWQPTGDLLIRGTFAEGFRAPSIGELFGSASRFDAVLADPCSDFNNTGVSQAIVSNCIAQGVPADGSYIQINPQISVVTGGNPDVQPEESDSYTLGGVYSPDWMSTMDWVDVFDVEFTYYDIEVDGAIQAIDAQTQLTACVNTNDPSFCNGINRNSTGNIAGFNNRLTNIGGIDTKGWDLNFNYFSPEYDHGRWGVQWLNTIVDEFTEINLDTSSSTGFSERPLEGIEVNNSAVPEWQSNLYLNWYKNDWKATYSLRHTSDVVESCSDFLDGSPNSLTALGLCSNPHTNNDSLSTNKLGSTTYHDIQVSWSTNWDDTNMIISGGINNLFDKGPPVCLSCSLNGHDPSTYDLPGRFGYLSVDFRFD